MSNRAGFYGNRQRTQRDKLNDAIQFICNARPVILLATTAEKLCLDKGITDRNVQREVEVKLLVAQRKERERA